jgi:hypothetical protein
MDGPRDNNFLKNNRTYAYNQLRIYHLSTINLPKSANFVKKAPTLPKVEIS